jgi:hypothetical protein
MVMAIRVLRLILRAADWVARSGGWVHGGPTNWALGTLGLQRHAKPSSFQRVAQEREVSVGIAECTANVVLKHNPEGVNRSPWNYVVP